MSALLAFVSAHPFAAIFLAAATLLAIHQQIVYWCTVAHNFLPPWEFLQEFPRLLRYYRLFVYLVGWGAGNFRTSVWPQLSTAEGKKTSSVANGGSPKT